MLFYYATINTRVRLMGHMGPTKKYSWDTRFPSNKNS